VPKKYTTAGKKARRIFIFDCLRNFSLFPMFFRPMMEFPRSGPELQGVKNRCEKGGPRNLTENNANP
jgi:hypothetical protein